MTKTETAIPDETEARDAPASSVLTSPPDLHPAAVMLDLAHAAAGDLALELHVRRDELLSSVGSADRDGLRDAFAGLRAAEDAAGRSSEAVRDALDEARAWSPADAHAPAEGMTEAAVRAAVVRNLCDLAAESAEDAGEAVDGAFLPAGHPALAYARDARALAAQAGVDAQTVAERCASAAFDTAAALNVATDATRREIDDEATRRVAGAVARAEPALDFGAVRASLWKPARAALVAVKSVASAARGLLTAPAKTPAEPEAPVLLDHESAAHEAWCDAALDDGMGRAWERDEAEFRAAKVANEAATATATPPTPMKPSPMAAWAAGARKRSGLRRDDQAALAREFDGSDYARDLALHALPAGGIAVDGRWDTRDLPRTHSWLALVRQDGRKHHEEYLASVDGLGRSAFRVDAVAIGDVLEAGHISRNANGRVRGSERHAYLVVGIDARTRTLKLEWFACPRDAFAWRRDFLARLQRKRDNVALAHALARDARRSASRAASLVI